MKKEFLLGAMALLISAGVMAQTTEPVQTQTKTKKQLRIEARQQAQVQDQVQSGDPIMKKEQTRTRDQKKEKIQDQTHSGDPIMTKKHARRQNHGAAVSETAKQAQTQTEGGVGEIVREQAKLHGEAQKATKQAKTSTQNKGAAKGVRANRPATVRGSGSGRR